jgi:hypothetical protein
MEPSATGLGGTYELPPILSSAIGQSVSAGNWRPILQAVEAAGVLPARPAGCWPGAHAAQVTSSRLASRSGCCQPKVAPSRR